MSRWVLRADALVAEAPPPLVGGEAAGLATLARLGCPVPDFAVVTTRAWRDCEDGTGEIPVALRAELVETWAALGGGPVAVRSSAVTGAVAESVLGVQGIDSLVHAVRACWASSPGPVAVVLQRQIEGEVSGVLRSRDPDDPDQVLVTLRLGPALSEADTRRLFLLGRRLEEEVGLPVDVEFTVTGGRLYLLQVRPLTVPIPAGRRQLWDHASIVDSYPGVTTPLTFSFASRVHTVAYQRFCRVMGASDEAILASEHTFGRMLGIMRGRVYHNHDAWYRVLSLLPGLSLGRGAMAAMLGVSEATSDEHAGAARGRWAAGLSLRFMGRLAWRLFSLEWDARRFRGTCGRALRAARSRDLSALRADELLEAYESAERDLLWAWTPPLVNDFFCLIFCELLQRSCRRISGDEATRLHDRLLAGHGDPASAAPEAELVSLAELALDAHRVHQWLVSDEDDDVVKAEVMRHDGFRGAFERWLDAWGDRSPHELELGSPTLRDTPKSVLQTLRGWLRRGELPRLGEEQQRIRREAEREWRQLVPVRSRPLQGWILSQARRRVAMREELRFERIRVFGLARDLFRAFGERYAAVGALDSRDDVFFLTLDEVLGYTRGTTPTTDLRGLVAVRRAEHRAHAAAPPPAERFHTWGAVHLANRF